MRCLFGLCVLFLGFTVVGCGQEMARVKGRLLENGQPKTFPALLVSVTFTPVAKDGGEKPAGSSFTTPVNGDGSFEVLVSGGQLPPGEYEVLVELRSVGKGGNVIFRRELKPGLNDVSLDIAKPGS